MDGIRAGTDWPGIDAVSHRHAEATRAVWLPWLPAHSRQHQCPCRAGHAAHAARGVAYAACTYRSRRAAAAAEGGGAAALAAQATGCGARAARDAADAHT